MPWMLALLMTAVLLADHEPAARVRVTQRDLVPTCMNGTTVSSGTRSWKIPPGLVTMAFTMRSGARPVSSGEAGTAALAFTAESNHRYEVEVRADAMAFSTRDWRARAWTPVVRDRTTERIVSTAPEWTAAPCPLGAW